MVFMEGKYILHHNEMGTWTVLREKRGQNLVYEVVIPDAGDNREFAFGLVSMLNSQGSEVGRTAE